MNFAERHGATGLRVVDGALTGSAADGSTFAARLPFDERVRRRGRRRRVRRRDRRAAGRWGVLLVRKGGFAVARLEGDRIVESKVGQRHVQGRTKAGGQSQQRFARRRDNQARQAYEAAADHAARILGPGRLAVVDRWRPRGGGRGPCRPAAASRRRWSAPGSPCPTPERPVLGAGGRRRVLVGAARSVNA